MESAESKARAYNKRHPEAAGIGVAQAAEREERERLKERRILNGTPRRLFMVPDLPWKEGR